MDQLQSTIDSARLAGRDHHRIDYDVRKAIATDVGSSKSNNQTNLSDASGRKYTSSG